MNRIDRKLAELTAGGKKMLSPYLTAGDPSLADTLTLMHGLVDAGADILEIGIPFSDPMAEGPVIQAAMERALAQGVTCQQVLDMVARFRQTNNTTPVVLMGYLNPIECYGYERFAKAAHAAGVDGTILVDLPPEESHTILPLWQAHSLYSIYLCSPTTSSERLALINQVGAGYLYYVSLKGVTGSNAFDLADVKQQYELRKAQITLPLMVGFGIKTADMAAGVAQFADGIIVGAALISTILAAHTNKQDIVAAATTLIASMRQEMDKL